MRLLLHSAILLLLSALAARGDSLILGGTSGVPGALLQLPFNFLNSHQIVGVQFDLAFPADLVDVGAALVPSELPSHQVESRDLEGVRRIVLYSPSNQILPDDLIMQVPVTLKAGSPEGGPTLKVRNIILTNKLGQSFTPTINRAAIDAWRLAHFSEAQLDDPQIVGDDRNPDGDYLSNLLELLMGGDPLVAEDDLTPKAAHGRDPGDNQQYFTLTFRAAKNITAGELSVERSSELVDWDDVGVQLVATGVEDTETIEYEASILAEGIGHQYLRLVGHRTDAAGGSP